MDKTIVEYSFTNSDTGNNIIGASFSFPGSFSSSQLYLTRLQVSGLISDPATSMQIYARAIGTFKKVGISQDGLTGVLSNLVGIGAGTTLNSQDITANSNQCWEGRVPILTSQLFEMVCVIGETAPNPAYDYWVYVNLHIEGAFFG